MNYFIDSYPIYQLIIFVILVVSATVEIAYWLRCGRVATHRHRDREPEGSAVPPVSVVVVVADDPDYIGQRLEMLLTQNHPHYEVVVVDDGKEEDLTEQLIAMQSRYTHLRYTTIKADPVFRHSRKLALTIGIKAARYENIIFTDADSNPSSNKWLSIMARGFNGGRIVLGYTGIEPGVGFANRMIRCQRLTTSIRYLSAAIAGRPYRGIYNNIGYTKSIFFDNGGFTHLRMTIGEDDLYIQKIAKNQNASIMLNPQATMHQKQQGGMRWWRMEQKYRSSAFDLYPRRVRFGVFCELLSRALTTLSTAAILLLLPPVLWIAALSIFVVRQLVMILVTRAIAHRVGERGIMWVYIIHDMIAPISELTLWISRKLRPSPRLWI